MRFTLLMIGIAAALFFVVYVGGCTATDRAAISAADKCAVSVCLDAGPLDPGCITIEELQPFVPLILARRNAANIGK